MDTEAKQWAATRWVLRYRIAFLLIAGMAVVVTVAGVAGYSSWGHIVHVGRMVHEPAAAWLPVSIDGLMIAGAIMQAIDRLRRFKPRPWATVSLWLGATLTITYNVVSAWERGFWGCAVAVTPAVALLVLVEGATRPGRVVAVIREAREAVQAVVAAVTAPVPAAPVPAPMPAPWVPIATPEATSEAPVVAVKAAPRKRATPAKKTAKPPVAMATESPAPRKRAPRTSSGLKATGPGTRPRKLAVAPDYQGDTVTVDTVLPANGRPSLHLVPAFAEPDTQS